MRHADSKTEFATGAHRDSTEGKGRPSLISPILIHRLGVQLGLGEDHYGADNWCSGMPFRRTADSLIRHIGQWLAGDEEEDHLAAIAANTMFLMYYEYGIESGLLPESLDDRSSDLKKIFAAALTSKPPMPKVECGETKVPPAFNDVLQRYTMCCKCGKEMEVSVSGPQFTECLDCYREGIAHSCSMMMGKRKEDGQERD